MTDTEDVTDTADVTDEAVAIDSVDLTDETIFAVVNSTPQLSELTALLQAAQVEVELTEGGPFTLFAPTNDAIAALPADTLETLQEDLSVLADVMQYHLVADDVLAEELVELGEALSLTGDLLEIAVTDDGEVTVNGALVVEADIETANGTIHIIDGVLLPPGQ